MEPVNTDAPAARRPARLSIGVPGMAPRRSIGLGSVIRRLTSAVGIRPCGGCRERAARLDRMVEFRGRDWRAECWD